MEYRGWNIAPDFGPTPDRSQDYEFYHPDFDGPGDRRHGRAASVRDCMMLIDELLDTVEKPTDEPTKQQRADK
jgi:hypothetical protein